MLYPAELRARSIKSCYATERVAVHYLILLGLCISNSAVAFRIACLPVHPHRERVPEVVHTWCRSTFAAVQARRKLLIILLLLKVPQHSRSGKASARAFCPSAVSGRTRPAAHSPFLGQNSHGLARQPIASGVNCLISAWQAGVGDHRLSHRYGIWEPRVLSNGVAWTVSQWFH